MAKKSKKKSSDSLLKAFSNTNCKSLLVTGLVVFIVMFILDFLVHGYLFKADYIRYANLMLPQKIMEARMPFMMLGQLLMSLLLVLVYSQGFTGKGSAMEGARYGIYVGLLMTLPKAIMMYSWALYPVVLLVKWGVAGFITIVVLGAIIGAMYKK